MKKLLLLFVATIALTSAQAQYSRPDIQVDPRLNEVLGESQINDLRANNPKKLVEENCNLISYCFFAAKLINDPTYQMKGELKNYVKAGKSCDYQEIIKNGAINRYDYNLEQDLYKQNVYPLGNTGTYIIVFSKEMFDNTLKAYYRVYGLE